MNIETNVNPDDDWTDTQWIEDEIDQEDRIWLESRPALDLLSQRLKDARERDIVLYLEYQIICQMKGIFAQILRVLLKVN